MKEVEQIYIMVGHWPVSRGSSPLSLLPSALRVQETKVLWDYQQHATSAVLKLNRLDTCYIENEYLGRNIRVTCYF